ncbi:MAG: 6-pyruvoyl-tetrahydropterin synthase-related protein [Acidobacteriaceae bacterium]
MKVSFRFPASVASDATRAIRRRSLMLAVVGIAVLPLAWRGTSCGQDFDFHLQNWLETARSWHQGMLNPHWAASANYLAGEPRFVFYPPLSRFLGAALGLVLPWAWTPLVVTLVALLGAAFSMRAMAREWAGDDNAAVAACLYVLNPYTMFVIYERGAMAELLAAAWVPLLVLYGLRQAKSWLPLALTVAAVWLTNAPAAVMGCYALAVLVAVAALREHSWKLVARAACAVPLGMGLAGYWLVPAIYEQRWVQIDRAIGPLMRVQDSFLFGYAPLVGSGDELFDVNYHNQVLRLASWVVVALMAATMICAWAAWRRKTAVWLPLVVAGAAVCALPFRWSEAVWRLAPKLEFLQFPWRWMLVVGMIFAALAGLALPKEFPTRRVIAVRALLLLALAGGMAALASRMYWQACDDEDNVQAQQTTFQQTGFPGTDEYTPVGVTSDLPEDGPEVRVESAASAGGALPAQVKIQRWQTERMDFEVTSPVPGYAILRLMDYPAWGVTRNGTKGVSTPRSDGWMAIPIEAGSNEIEVQWRTTWDAWAGLGISFLAMMITLAFGWGDRRKG